MNFTDIKAYNSKAKLMISGEYLVLKGALSLALPLKYGQRLTIRPKEGKPIIKWKSLVNNNLWFKATLLLPDFRILSTNLPDLAEKLCNILLAAKALNHNFPEPAQEYRVTSEMDFNPEWGMGSSSSLISNIAAWADCDPFKLNKLVFNGSGYDIACARSSGPIIYEIREDIPTFRDADFHPSFYRKLFFVYLNRKQNSKESIQKLDLSNIKTKNFNEISELTLCLEKSDNLEVFQSLIVHHEEIMGNILKKKPVKELYFNDFNGAVKSLGAWGGDFILAASAEPGEYVRNYFKNKNLNTIFSYDEIVL